MAQHADDAGGEALDALLARAEAGPPKTLRFARSCSSALSPALLDRAERAYGVPVPGRADRLAGGLRRVPAQGSVM